MQLFKKETHFEFMSYRKIALTVSGILLLVGLLSISIRGLEFGIDFTGGTLIEFGYPNVANMSEIRGALSDAGFDEAVVQNFGTAKDILVRIAPRNDLSKADLSSLVIRALEQATPGIEMRRVEFVGPQVGVELREQGGLAMLYALGAILIYVMFRFEWRFAVGSVAALVHDVLITIGIFSLIGLEFDLTVLAAILAVIGYSLNDTIVVFDRIRENFRKIRKGEPFEIVNRSLNQTLSRTLMTSFTTLIVLIALFSLGGELIRGFSVALIVGVLVGTYSSMYVAGSTILYLGVSKADLMPVKKEGGEHDSLP